MTKQNNIGMRAKRIRLSFSGAMLAFAMTGAVILPAPNQVAQAQIPGLLPKAEQVPATDPMVIDGIWKIRELGKHIVIEQGRAYALESWIHAFVFEIQPDMVVLRDFEQTAPNVYIADDLPLMARATMTVQEDGVIKARVASLVPVTYHLDPVELFYPQHFVTAISDSRIHPNKPQGYRGYKERYSDRPRLKSGKINPKYSDGPRVPAQVTVEPDFTEFATGESRGVDEALDYGDANESGLSDNAKLGIGTVVAGGIAYKASGAIANTAKTVGTAGKVARGAKGANAAAAVSKGGFGRGLIQKAGPGGIEKIIGKGDAARAARGAGLANESQLIRQINKTGDVAKLNKAGRAAQVARGAGGIKAASTAADAAKLGKMAKVGASAGKLGKAGRAAVAGTGIGAVVVAAEIIGTEGVEALTGAELQDPISTGFQYGAAIFDKDVKISDVAKARLEHHKENFRRIGETFTEPGKVKENLTAYGNKTRGNIENVTGMELQSGKDRRAAYEQAMTSDKPVAATAKVAGDRAKHHLKNTGKVTKKIGCGIGNIFRKKDKDKKC